MSRHGLDSSGSGQGNVAGYCEFGNKTSGSINCGEFLDYPFSFSGRILLHEFVSLCALRQCIDYSDCELKELKFCTSIRLKNL